MEKNVSGNTKYASHVGAYLGQTAQVAAHAAKEMEMKIEFSALSTRVQNMIIRDRMMEAAMADPMVREMLFEQESVNPGLSHIPTTRIIYRKR